MASPRSPISSHFLASTETMNCCARNGGGGNFLRKFPSCGRGLPHMEFTLWAEKRGYNPLAYSLGLIRTTYFIPPILDLSLMDKISILLLLTVRQITFSLYPWCMALWYFILAFYGEIHLPVIAVWRYPLRHVLTMAPQLINCIALYSNDTFWRLESLCKLFEEM